MVLERLNPRNRSRKPAKKASDRGGRGGGGAKKAAGKTVPAKKTA